MPPLLLLLPSLPRGRRSGAALLGAGKSQGAACRRPYPSLLCAVPALPTLEKSCSREWSCPQETEGGHSPGPCLQQALHASSCSSHPSQPLPAMGGVTPLNEGYCVAPYGDSMGGCIHVACCRPDVLPPPTRGPAPCPTSGHPALVSHIGLKLCCANPIPTSLSLQPTAHLISHCSKWLQPNIPASPPESCSAPCLASRQHPWQPCAPQSQPSWPPWPAPCC